MLDLRKAAVPPPAAAAQVPLNGLPPAGAQPVHISQVDPGFPVPPAGAPPLATGSLVLTPHMRQQLAAVGWQDGDPLPGNMGQLVDRCRHESLAEQATVPTNVQGAKLPKMLNIADLPPEKQAELRSALQQAKRDMAQLQAAEMHEQQIQQHLVPKAGEGVNAALRVAAEAALAAPAVHVLHDLPPTPTAPPAQPPPQPPQPAQPPPAASTPPPEPTESRSGALDAPRLCPRCCWDQRQPFDMPITDADKATFVTAVLGGQRFRKDVELLGGRLRVTYRGLTTAEADLVFTQLSYDVRAGKIVGDGEYYMRLMDYRLAISLERIAGSELVFTIDPLDQIVTDPLDPDGPPMTKLPAVRDYVNNVVLANESTRRLVGREHSRFQRLTEALEALAASSDF